MSNGKGSGCAPVRNTDGQESTGFEFDEDTPRPRDPARSWKGQDPQRPTVLGCVASIVFFVVLIAIVVMIAIALK